MATINAPIEPIRPRIATQKITTSAPDLQRPERRDQQPQNQHPHPRHRHRRERDRAPQNPRAPREDFHLRRPMADHRRRLTAL